MKNVVFRVCLFFLLITIGCAGYRAVALPRLQPEFAPYSEEQDGVTIACKAFTKSDCKKYFDRDLIRKGYQPVQISIQNETKKYLLFSSQGISLPCVSADEVSGRAHTSTVGRATTYGVVGLFLWPLLIPAIVDGVGSSQANRVLDNDFAAKGANAQVIQPYATLNGVLFIPTSEFQENFTITLVDKERKDKFVFTVFAPKQ